MARPNAIAANARIPAAIDIPRGADAASATIRRIALRPRLD